MLYDSLNDKVLWYFLLNQTTTIRGLRGFTFPKSASALAPVVQRLNNSIHRKNWYLVDKCNQNKQRYLLDSDLPGGERIHLSNSPCLGKAFVAQFFHTQDAITPCMSSNILGTGQSLKFCSTYKLTFDLTNSAMRQYPLGHLFAGNHGSYIHLLGSPRWLIKLPFFPGVRSNRRNWTFWYV